MKNSILLIVFLVFFINILPSSAQNAVGFRMGVNYAGWRTAVKGTKQFEDHGSSQLFPVFSMPFEFDLSKSWTIQFEPTMIWKGTKIDYIKDGHTYAESRLSLWYAELPILAKFYFDRPKTGFHFLLGPSVGYALGGKVKKGNNPLNQGARINDIFSFEKNGFPYQDFSIIAGLGSYKGKHGFDIRYAYGLTDLGLNGEGSAKYYNQSFQFNYIFNFWNNRKTE